MADTEAGGNLKKIVGPAELGKSTLVPNPILSIPMPRGATPPRTPPGQGQGGATSDSQGSKKKS
jgi:hypothetical protein